MCRKHISVKEAVFPFNKFPGVDTMLGPEMKSTGEVMGIDDSFGLAFAKAQLGGGMRLPKSGKAVHQRARRRQGERHADCARNFTSSAFRSSRRAARRPTSTPTACPRKWSTKSKKAARNIGDQIKNGEIAHGDQHARRRSLARGFLCHSALALDYQVPYFTTIAGADAAAEGIEYLSERDFDVKALQDYGVAPLP